MFLLVKKNLCGFSLGVEIKLKDIIRDVSPGSKICLEMFMLVNETHVAFLRDQKYV